MIYIMGVCFALLLALGQVLFKQVAITSGTPKIFDFILSLATNSVFWCALLIYAVATLLWILILQKFALSKAYAFNAIGFLVVPLLGNLFFGEPLTLRLLLGSVIIITGVLLVVPS